MAPVFLGGSFMNHDADHPCLFSLMAGINCLSADRLAMINHFFSGWRSLTAAIIDFKAIVLILAFFGFLFIRQRQNEIIFQKAAFFRFYDLASINNQKKKFSRWLSLHCGLY